MRDSNKKKGTVPDGSRGERLSGGMIAGLIGAARYRRLGGGYLLLAIMLLATVGCSTLDRFIFTPKRDVPTTPEKYSIAYQEVWFASQDGTRLNGWFVPGGTDKPLVLYFHGNGGSLSDNLEYIRLLNRSGFPVFIFDYRGFGKSDGNPLREKDLYQDARGALAYLEQLGLRPDRMIFFGQSLGSAVALQMALEKKPFGLVLESSFTSISEMFKLVFPFGYYIIGWWHDNFPFNNLDKISRVDIPLLLIHGTQDHVIPVHMTQRLYDRARDPKMLYIIEGGGHCDVFERDPATYLGVWESYRLMLTTRTASP